MTPTNAELRHFIIQFFSDEELVTLCFDYFPEVSQNFAEEMSKNRKALALISYCDNRDLLANLYVTLAKERPSAWQKQFPAEPVETLRRNVPPPTRQPTYRNPRQIFLSHATSDTEFAQRLASDLREEGWPLWIAPDSIRPGEKWVEAINRGLEESGIFVVALTPDAVSSSWVKTETNAAIDLYHVDEIRLVTLDVAKCTLPVLWRQYQYIPFRSSYEAGLGILLDWLDGGRLPVSAPRFGMAGTLTTIHIKGSGGPTPDRRIHAMTGIELIRVPAGPFLYGSADNDTKAYKNEKPQRIIDLPEYWIGRTPVTNTQYKLFADATNYRRPGHWQGNTPPQDKLEHPVVNINWNDAQAFCEWAGLQLPSEQEWEKAARGVDGRIWPWGNTLPTDDYCNFDGNVGDTTPVGRFSPHGDSPFGCEGMAGNVWEWTASSFSEGTYAVRGGSWLNDKRDTRAAFRHDDNPGNGYINIGFRVAEHLSDF